MNILKTIPRLKILIVLQLFSMLSVAGTIRFHNRMQTSYTSTVTVNDTMITEVSPKTGSFKDLQVSDILTVGIDPFTAKYLGKDSLNYKISLRIDAYNAANTLISTSNQTLTVIYNPFKSPFYKDQSIYVFNKAYKYKITYLGTKINGVSSSNLPKEIFIDGDIEVDRYYNFYSSVSSTFTVNTPTPLNIDCDTDTIYDELNISWNTCFGSGTGMVCPESYDFEWTFVNDYDTAIGLFKSNTILHYDFTNNSTRVNITDNFYRISLVYEHGYLLYRVRGVGNDTSNINNILYGVWSIADNGTISSVANYHIIKEHEGGKNWQYNASFAEEGKKKEVLAYYDGSLRNRQSVTKMNSDKNTLVGETIYDYQGRPAVNVLPGAVDFPSCSDSISEPAIKFYPNFNKDDAAYAYSRNDFDVDSAGNSCASSIAPMGTTSGASRYYSPANPNKTEQQAFLPDAKKYPFTQVEYTPDNTGRIKRQGGVGIKHQLNTGHEAIYYYGQPSQLELDRMFGSEVGDATHYKKNVVIDANGQTSMTYINQEGKTIATSLAGDSAIGLAKIPSNKSGKPKHLTVDLFNKNALGNSKLDTVNISGNAIEFNTQILVAYNSNYTFSYSMKVDTMRDACLNSGICFNCIYDLEMHIYNDCGVDVLEGLLGDTLKKTIGHFTKDADSNLVFTAIYSGTHLLTEKDSFPPLFLKAGNYTLSKVLKVNPQAINYYVSQYLDSANNSCYKTLHSFIDSALSKVDTSNCHITCASCVAALGDRDAFVASGKGTYMNYDALVAACEQPCQSKSVCYVTYVQMLADMAPGGQYGGCLDNTDSINTSAFPLSVYNTNTSPYNYLPKDICSGTYYHAANWHHPVVTLNNTTYPYYLDENGFRTSINLTKDSTGYFTPAVMDTSSTKIFFNGTTSTYYTYPENLSNFADFWHVWDPNWEASLVIYHPEYNYYLNCSKFSNTYTGNSMSSDGFDGLLQNTNTFANAASVGFVKSTYSSYPYKSRLNDFSLTTGLVYDPFLTHFGSFGTKLKNLLTNYKPNPTHPSGDTLTMGEMAAFITRCGTLYGNSDTAGCISFGAGAVDSIKNNEWKTFVGLYLAAKQNLKNQYLDSIVKTSTNPGYNGCFGDSIITYNGSLALGSQYFNSCQPCSQGTYALYAKKTPRFGTAPIPTSYNAASYLTYLSTGQCPLAFDLQNMLNQIAFYGRLKTSTSQYMHNYSAFSPDLYVALGTDTSNHHYQKYYWNSTFSGSAINGIFKDSVSNAVCSINFDLSSSGISSLGKYKVVGVSGLADTTYSSYANAFRVFLALVDTTSSSPTTIYKKALGYSSCFNLTNCKFQEQCEPNNFALDLQNLMTPLAFYGNLESSNISLDDTTYSRYITSALKNQLGTTTSNKLIWNYSSSKVFQLYDSLKPSVKIMIKPISTNPTALLTGTLTATLKKFSSINSLYYNLFTINALNSSNTKYGPIIGEASKWVVVSAGDTIKTPISMGTCGYQTSFNCQGPAYELQNELQLLIHDALTSMPASHDVDLTKIPSYSHLLANSFPLNLDSTSSDLKYHTTGWGNYKTQLLFRVKSSVDSCYFSLNADTIHAFDSIVDFYNLKAYGNADASGNYHQFKGIVKYSRHDTISIDTIYGQSCLPIQTCCACGTNTVSNTYVAGGTPTDTCSSLYSQYVTAITVNGDTLTHHSMTPLSVLSYSLITNDNYCNCLRKYNAYVNYITTHFNGTKPVPITQYTGCPDMSSGCASNYSSYLSIINTFDKKDSIGGSLYGYGLPSINRTLYPSSDFMTNGFCYCASAYISYIESIIDGTIPPSQVDTSMLKIANYCPANYQPPCKTYVQPDTGSTGFPIPTVSVTPSPDTSCALYAVNLAIQSGTNQYNQYKDSLTTSIAGKYLHHCLGAFETFTERYLDKQYHYTLYYYDQAGNLIRTVPPEGVRLISDTTSPTTPLTTLTRAEDSICYDRTYNQRLFYTHHSMPTTYLYNSLNQLVKQYLPDHDPMSIWEYSMPSGLDSKLKITGVQFVDDNTGYLSGYTSLSSTITPGISKRGYIYHTSDGGKSWTPMQDVVASSLNKIQMVTNYSGYAVGNKGMILKTVDDGATWDVVPVFNKYTGIWTTSPDWKDLYFKDSTKGVIVGTGGKSLLIDFTQSNPAKYIKPISLSGAAVDNLTGVTYDGSNVYASAIGSTGTYGLIYKSTLDPYATDSLVWNPVTGLQGTNLLDVQFLRSDSTKAFIGGNNGTLLKTTDRGATWGTIPTNVTGNIQKVYFRNDSLGVALIDSLAGYSQLYRTSNGGSTWTLTGARGKYYNDMSFYQNSTASTSDKAYVVGKSGLISRLIASTNTISPYYGISPYFGASQLNSPNAHVDFTSVSAANYTVGGVLKSKVVVGASNGKVYYSSNADSTYLIWDSIVVAPSSTKLTHIVSLLSGTTYTFIVAATGDNGYLYGSKISTAVTNTITSGSFVDVALNKGLTTGYTFDNSAKKVYKLGFSGTTLTITLIGSANSSIINAHAIGCSGNLDLIVAGDSGGIYKDTSLISSPAWGASSAAIKFAPLNDIQADSMASASVYAIGNNGTLLQKKTGATIWKKINTSTSINLNSIKFYNRKHGIIAANGANMYSLGINTSSYSVTTTHVTPPSYITQNLIDIAVNTSSKQVFAVGNNGVAMYINDITASSPTPYQINLGALHNNFRGVFSHASGQLACVGDSNQIINAAVSYTLSVLTTIVMQKINQIFGPAIQKAHFFNGPNGYLVGDYGFIRHTIDGQTWQTVLPDLSPSILDTLTNVFTTKPDFALVTGKQAYLAKINQTTVPAQITIGSLSGTPGLNDIGFGVNSPNAGYVCGDNETMLQVSISGTTVSASAMTTTLSTLFSGGGYNLKALHVFPDNSLMAVGSKGLAAFYNVGSNKWYSHIPPSTSFLSNNFNDVFFHDDQNGYVVGDKGVVLRWQSFSNIQSLTSTTVTSASNFIAKATKDKFGVSDSTKINISCVDFSSRYYGLLGGAYPDSINNADYARYLHDESSNFSTSFWYDQLGRMVISQNSKQFATIPKQFSYTLYDALGRIIEVGQKNDNTDTANYNFNELFCISQNNYTLFNGMTNRQVIYQKFEDWATAERRTQVTQTFYDSLVFDSLPIVQQNLRKRVSSVLYADTLKTNTSVNYNHATHYSYDIHGNVNTLLQDNPNLESLKQKYKRIDYDYDLISGKVNYVYYQRDSIDQFTHKYEYDADNRLTDVHTSANGVVWDKDAKYYYYAHGPLARVEYGHNHLQGVDYYYTIQGWIKGVNSNLLNPKNDGGADGLIATGNPNSNFARDAFGYTLGYFSGDYSPIDTSKWNTVSKRFEANTASSSLLAARYDLYNGNIGHMVTSIIKPDTNYAPQTILPQGTAYQYDQLNRLTQMKAFTNISANAFGTTTYTGTYNNRFSYDANGNILSQVRKNQAGVTFDSLVYQYNIQNGNKLQNRLYNVHDTIAAGVMSDDIDNQGVFNSTLTYMNTNNNYKYDQIGNLVRDSAEGIAKIDWTVYGKIKNITHRTGYYKLNGTDTVRPPNLTFNYDAAGNRISKVVMPRTATGVKAPSYYTTIFYVRDAQGNVMSVYTEHDSTAISTLYFKQTEKHIYGSSRIGIDETQTQLIGASRDTVNLFHNLGNKLYEMNNHLGNVLTTVSDIKLPVDTNGDGTIDRYVANIRSATDYYGGGSLMPGRSFNANSYNYGMNGQMKTDEWNGVTGSHYTAEFWEYDSRLIWRQNPDPVVKPWESPYACFGGNPILNVDPLGNDWFKNESTGKTQWSKATGKQGEQVSLKGSEDTWTNLGTEFLEFNGTQFKYSQQTSDKEGNLKVNSQTFDAVSGKPDDVSGGWNVVRELGYSKSRQGTSNVGPTPEGLYSINKQDFVEGTNESGIAKYGNLSLYDQAKSLIGGSSWPGGTSSWGDTRWKLNFEDVNTPRTNFYLHGGSVWGSRGCIDLGSGINNFSKSFMGLQSGNSKVFLKVAYEKDLKFQYFNLPTNQPLQIKK